ncbi:MAG: urea transporter [Cyanobacteria bacterium J06635_10]
MPRSFGSVFFSLNLISGLLILAAVFLCSPISGVMGLMGSVMSVIVANALGIDLQSVYVGLWGFNSVLTAIALGGVFYAPLPIGIGIALLAALVCALLHGGLLLIFASTGLPVLALAFTITTISVFLILKHSILSLVPVALYTITCPEEHYKRYQIAKNIISSFRTQLQEAIQGKPTFFLFQNISSELKGELRYIFNAIDTDNSEEISLSELKTYLRIADDSLSDAEINYLFDSIDIDKSGKIDFE